MPSIKGTSSDDTLTATGSDSVAAGYGNDTITATWASGTSGNVMIDAGAGHDAINVTFSGSGQGVTAEGGSGLDIFTISGHGAVTIDAGADDDTIALTNISGATLTLGAGSDRVIFNAQDAHPTVTITDFQAGAGGDVLDLSTYLDAALTGWDHESNPFGNGLMRLSSAGADTTIQVYTGGSWYDLVVLKNVTASSLVAANLSGFSSDGSEPEVTMIEGPVRLAWTGEIIRGLSGPDYIVANSPSDTVYGGAGDDVIYGAYWSGSWRCSSLDGGSGNDTLYCGQTMTGGTGADTFIYEDGNGDETITDFTPGVDKLVLYGYSADDVFSITASLGFVGTQILMYNGGSIWLRGVDPSALQAQDIVFSDFIDLPDAPDTGTPTGTAVTGALEPASDYTLAAGDTLWLDDAGHFALDHSATIAGTLYRTADTMGGWSIFNWGYGAGASDVRTITIAETGVVDVHITRDENTQTQRDTVYFAYGDTFSVDNRGTINIVNDHQCAVGIYTTTATNSWTNSGTLNIWAGGSRQGTFYYGSAVGIDFEYGGTFVNTASGVVSVTGAFGAIAVSLAGSGGVAQVGYPSFTNAGTITAASGAITYAAIAVWLGNPAAVFNNSGTITADYALYVDDYSSKINASSAPYVNSGKMYGILHFSDADETLINTGLINGAVQLGWGNDSYNGSGGTQYQGVYGDEGNDTLIGGSGTEYLFGGEGDDVIRGGGGNDFIDGGRGTNSLDGGDGADTLSFASSDVGVTVDLMAGSVAAPRITDTIANFENVTGSIFADTLTGTAGDNVIEGKQGDDVLTGGAGNDTFVFTLGDGNDTVTDFAAGSDSLVINGYSTYRSLTQVGSDVLMALSDSDSILFRNTTVASLASATVTYVPVLAPSRAPASPAIPGKGGYDVLGDFTVATGETQTFKGIDCAYFLSSDLKKFAFTNNGAISVSSAGDVNGIESAVSGSGNVFLNAAGASFTVTYNGAPTGAVGIYTPTNNGVDLVNNGIFSISSTNDATGVFGCDMTQKVTNNSIYTVTGEADAIGVRFTNGGVVLNSGTVVVHGGTSAVGIYSDRYFDESELGNAGTLTVMVDDPDAKSYGIRIDSYEATTGSVVTNSGTITADVALEVLAPAGYSLDTYLTFNNSGTVNGDIDTAVATTVNNTGTINGNIVFGGEPVAYSGASGILHGSITLGDGDATVLCGAEADTIIAGTGSATIDGGGGNDSITFQGPASYYSVVTSGSTTTVTNLFFGTATVLTNVEQVAFGAPVTFDPPIVVTQRDLTIPTGVTFAYTSTQLAGSPTITIDPDRDHLTSGLSLTNHGTIKFTSTFGNDVMFAISYQGLGTDKAVLTNDGTIDISVANGIAMTTNGAPGTIDNTVNGKLLVSGGAANGFQGATIDNAGAIRVTSNGLYKYSWTFGVRGTTITNSGSITVQAAEALDPSTFGYTVQAVVLSTTFTPCSLNNTGSISVSATKNNSSTVAVSGSGTVINSGQITGGYAVICENLTLQNTGTITGTIKVSTKSNIVNSGTIIGDVYCGSTASIYDGHLGQIVGKVYGTAGADTLIGGAGNDVFYGGDEHDTLIGGAGNDTLDGGSNIDTAVFSGNMAAYTITQGATGVFTVSGSDGTDTLTNIEYAKFDDKTVRLLPGTGTTINWSADPSTYMAGIRDFDGNDLGAASGWKLIGTADVNGDGTAEHILVNRTNGRWAELSTEADGKTYFSNNGWAGDTRVVGIYIDPLVTQGIVQAGSDLDSQRRFQNDLNIENIHGILGEADYNHDGLQEIYFSLTDGTAYLHAYMHADGNIQYANYQNEQQVKDYLTSNGYTSTTWAGWFPAAQNALAAIAA